MYCLEGILFVNNYAPNLRSRWDRVLDSLSTVQLPMDKLHLLYEEIFMDLFNKGEFKLCKALLGHTGPFISLKSHTEPLVASRYSKLESMLLLATADDGGSAKTVDSSRDNTETKRNLLVDDILSSGSEDKQSNLIIEQSQSNILMSLIADGIRYRILNTNNNTNTNSSDRFHYDILSGQFHSASTSSDNYTSSISAVDNLCTIRCNMVDLFKCGITLTASVKSPSSDIIALGLLTGEIILTNANDLKNYFNLDNNDDSIKRRLASRQFPFQLSDIKGEENDFLAMSSSITALAINIDQTLLASGDKDGTIIIWRLQDGKSMCMIPNTIMTAAADDEGVISVSGIKFDPTNKDVFIASKCKHGFLTHYAIYIYM